MKSPDVKFFVEQSYSKFCLYQIITRNNLKKEHAFATHKLLGFQDETFLANKLKSWGTLSYSLRINEL